MDEQNAVYFPPHQQTPLPNTKQGETVGEDASGKLKRDDAVLCPGTMGALATHTQVGAGARELCTEWGRLREGHLPDRVNPRLFWRATQPIETTLVKCRPREGEFGLRGAPRPSQRLIVCAAAQNRCHRLLRLPAV